MVRPARARNQRRETEFRVERERQRVVGLQFLRNGSEILIQFLGLCLTGLQGRLHFGVGFLDFGRIEQGLL